MRDRVSGLYATGTYSTPNIPSEPAPLGGGDQPSINLTRNVRANWNFTPKGSVTNQLTLSWDVWNNGQQPLGSFAGNADWVSTLGIKGLAPLYKTEFPKL